MCGKENQIHWPQMTSWNAMCRKGKTSGKTSVFISQPWLIFFDGKPGYCACSDAKTTVGASILTILKIFSWPSAFTLASSASCTMHVIQRENSPRHPVSRENQFWQHNNGPSMGEKKVRIMALSYFCSVCASWRAHSLKDVLIFYYKLLHLWSTRLHFFI